MTIKSGDRLPDATLNEFYDVEGNGCSVGPNSFKVSDLVKGKKIVIFGLAKGVDEIWCVSVNDAFVMGAWGREQKAAGKVRMMADGSAEFSKACGLTLDLTARGMGVRSDRYAMLVEDGVVKALNREAPGKFEVSSAEAMLQAL